MVHGDADRVEKTAYCIVGTATYTHVTNDDDSDDDGDGDDDDDDYTNCK